MILELTQQKRCLKTDAKKSKTTQKMTPKSVPKDDFISGVVPLGAPLVALTVLGHQTLAPSGPKVPPMIEKSTKNDTKDTLQLRKKSSQIQVFWEPGLADCTKRLQYKLLATGPGKWCNKPK